MNKSLNILLYILISLSLLTSSKYSVALEYKSYGYIQPEFSYFLDGKGRHNQSKDKSSVFSQGTFIAYVQNDEAKITVNAMGRYDDQDNNRTYFDLQKFKYEYFLDDATLSIGNDIIFWGVNESFHVVDIINQSNVAENLAGTKKLGQPMLALSLYKEI